MNIAGVKTTEVRVDAGELVLEGNLNIPAGAESVVIFVHGSGSSRHSPRNQIMAKTPGISARAPGQQPH